MAKGTLEFVKAALRRPLDVSTVFPTSRALAETMLDMADLARAERVIELGTGTGAITKHLAARLPPNCQYIGVELDAKMVEFMRREYPKLRFEQGLAESMGNWVAPSNADVVVSSLPWTVFPSDVQERTVRAITEALRPGGAFLTYVCANALIYPQARSFLNLLRESFRDVHRSDLEWRNIPPAFVYRSIK